MTNALKAGALYFAIVFAAGFAMGAMRVLLIAPRLGESMAVAVELPLILGISWIGCGRLVRWHEVAARTAPRIVMGGFALALLLMAEAGVSMLGFGRTLAQHLDHYRTVPSLIGLAGQIAFAGLPFVRRHHGEADASLLTRR